MYLLIIALVLSSYASTTASAIVYEENNKIEVINPLRFTIGSPQAEKIRSQLRKEFAPRDRELGVALKKLKASEDKLTKEAAIMSEADRKILERSIITQRRELKRNQDMFREDLMHRRNELK